MNKAIVDIDFTQGDDYLATLTFVDSTGAAIDMSAQTFTGKSRENPDSTVSWDWVPDETNKATGIVLMSLAHADTEVMPDVCDYQFRMAVGSSDVFTFMSGKVRIARSLF